MSWLVDYEKLTKSKEGRTGQKEIVNSIKDKILDSSDNDTIVVKGPAGTGKTLVLAHIGLQVPNKTGILFVYTKILVKFLRSAFVNSNRTETLEQLGVDSFFQWLFRIYKNTFHEAAPDIESFDEKTDYMIERLSGKIKSRMYDYVLIDEGQDFRPSVIAFIRKITRVLVFVGDENQAIYVSHKDDLADLTKLFGEHTSYFLKLSIRISPSLIALLYPYISQIEKYKKGLRFLKRDPEKSTLEDSMPLWYRDITYSDFINYFSETLAMEYIRSGKNIGIVCYHKKDVVTVYEKLLEKVDEKFVVYVTKDLTQEIDFSANKIFLLTMHSSKGLEFDNLLYLHINSTPRNGDQKLYDNLAYTVYTRPKEDLVIYSHDKNIPLKNKMNLDYMTIIDSLEETNEDEIVEIDIF